MLKKDVMEVSRCRSAAEPSQLTKSRLVGFIALTSLSAAAFWGYALLSVLGGGAPDGSFYDDEISDGAQFEFVVVGAGAAGCAVAARLAQAGRVLLVEAGGDAGLLAQMPGAFVSLTGSDLDWSYETIPNNKSCLATDDEACRFARGKCVGGSTCIHTLMYTRGNREDYNYGIPGWSWPNIEPYFLRFEGFLDSHLLPESSRGYHNTSGAVAIAYFGESENPWHSRIINGFQSVNFPHNLDVSGKSQIGVSKIPGYVSGGERVTTARAYLNRKVEGRALTLVKNTKCLGVIIDEDNVARGVILSQGNNKTIRVFASQEVILSAGAIGTTQLLMLSGIGPKDHLGQLGIPVKVNLPVGEDMSDHPISLVLVKVDDEYRSAITTLATKFLQVVQWLLTRTGPMTSNNLSDITAFVNTKCYDFEQKRLTNNDTSCELPTTQYIVSFIDKAIGRMVAPIYYKATRTSQSVLEKIFTVNDESSLILMCPVVLQPESRGWIRLASSDPFKDPLIMPNFLSDDRDVEEMVRAIKIIEDVLEMPAFEGFKASLVRLQLEGCETRSVEYWSCYVRHMTQSIYHAVGTAALGPVLDERLRVRGVRRLRVADASALPRLPRGNTAAAVIALGERLSDLVLQDHGRQTYIEAYRKASSNAAATGVLTRE